MANIKPLNDIAEKFTRVTPQRTEDYEKGVKNTTKDWAQNTSAAESAHEAGIQEAIKDKRFKKGVQKAGTEKWRAKSATKGVQNFGTGVQLAGEDYRQGFEPYAQAIQGLTLPPRYAKGDPRNLDRVKLVAQKLREVKKAR